MSFSAFKVAFYKLLNKIYRWCRIYGIKNRQTKYIDDVELTVKNLRNNVVVFPLSAAGGKVSVKIQRTEEDGWTN